MFLFRQARFGFGRDAGFYWGKGDKNRMLNEEATKGTNSGEPEVEGTKHRRTVPCPNRSWLGGLCDLIKQSAWSKGALKPHTRFKIFT